MTSRSYASTASRRREARITDEDVYDYTLRVAYLSHLMTPKVPSSAATDSPRERESTWDHHSSRLTGALSNSIYSIGDLFKDVGRDGPRSVKFPEKLLKVLDAKMQNIAMAKDPGYTDQQIRRTVAVFWGSLKEPNFHRQMKENRKIEELILMFVSTATAVLKKDPLLSGDEWKVELNNQIAQFIRIVRQCLSTISHVPPELTARLDMYSAKLVPSSAASDSNSDTTRVDRSSTPLPPSAIATNVADMPLVQTVARLFGFTEQEVQADLAPLRKTCTEKAALVDLKTCLKNINADAPFPGRRADFESEEAWQLWRTQELSHLSQLMVIMVQFNPGLAKSTPAEALPVSAASARPTSMYVGDEPAISRRTSAASRYSLSLSAFNPEAISDAVQTDDEAPIGHTYTYIPPQPKRFYKRLIELCIDYDLQAMSTLPEDQEVSLGILSPRHLEIINECAVRWRISSSYRVSCFLDIIKYKYEREEVPLECIPEALSMVTKTIQENGVEKWNIEDAEYLTQVYGALFNIFLGLLYHSLEDLAHLKLSDIEPYLDILERVRESGLMERYDVDVDARISDLRIRAREVAVLEYQARWEELLAEHTGVNRAMPLLLLTDWIEKQAKLLDKRFPEPILGKLDLVSLAMEAQVPLFLNELEDSQRRLLEGSMNQPTPDIPIEDIFALFRRTGIILSMHAAFCPDTPEDFDLSGYFEPYILQWLINTDNKTSQWVHNAVSVDQFEAEGEEGHSSSIIDLFESLKPPIDFLLDLKWPDPYKEAHFLTSLSKTINKAIEQYCRSVEELFMTEMYPRPSQEAQAAKQSAWIEKAKLTIAGEKKVEPFNFMASSCIKLNNIDAARKLLDQLYSRIDADKVAETMEQLPAPPVDPSAKPRFLFTVKIISAEGVTALDGSSKADTFVTLSDEKGVRLAKTRTIYEASTPRWEETFDISVEGSLWLMASVRDRTLIGKHDTLGRAYLCLEPRRFGDFLAHDLWLDLDTRGRVLIRVSMEGEKDDIQFYFGRAFRSLKRAESDMTRIFIDKMSPLISQNLSRTILKTLVKGTSTTYDYNKALGNVKEFYRSALGSTASDVQIPLPGAEKEKARIRTDQLTDIEIEQAISPLFDYFEQNLQVLNSSLNEATRETVMLRVWKEILIVIEGLLIPPLSESQSDMKPLTDKEVDIVFKWLKFLRDYFYAGGEGPVPLELLQNQKYRDVVSIRLYYDWHTDALMEECVRVMQQNLHAAPTIKKRAKSVYSQRNLGTIKDRKREKRKQQETSSGEVILRILRMRPNTSEFIAQQLQIMTAMQTEQEERMKRRSAQSRASRSNIVPPLPPIPQ